MDLIGSKRNTVIAVLYGGERLLNIGSLLAIDNHSNHNAIGSSRKSTEAMKRQILTYE